MTFNESIAFCPRCGSGDFPQKSPGFFLCAACAFHFHPNCSVAVAGIIVNDAGAILLIRRERDPGKGKWSVPGGFVDAGETAEAALAREIHEEVGLEVAGMMYLCSFPNPYNYKGVVFSVLDFVYVCRVQNSNVSEAPDEVGAHRWARVHEIDAATIAFPSIRHALEQFARQTKRAA